MSEQFRVERLSKQFNRRLVLNDISFSVLNGEVLGLIGPNGAGKTTLLECLAGLMPADGGTLSHEGSLLQPLHRKNALFYR